MPKIETHFHTKESSPCGYIPAEEGIKTFHNGGYDAVIVTDHFSRSVNGTAEGQVWDTVCDNFLSGWRAAKKAGELIGLHVYLGMELRFPYDENDFLVYGFDEAFLYEHPWIYEKNLETFSKLAHENGLLIIQAHPFREMCFAADASCLDGVEVKNYNPRHDSRDAMALAWARQNHLLMSAGSDYHQITDFSGAGIQMEHLPADETELAQWMRDEKYQILLLPRE
ncbi:PHP domain-containing protein [Yanshouia hominis]|uniref:Transposase n=1 Tax=Yanshouia hominis TaxID=2763673 RepID=A0ABR7NLH5_9FIRM|nr:PHP domain-containing protein [Yanshouia hominis]MBC8577267.1 transposase [Yanshouia hominis]